MDFQKKIWKMSAETLTERMNEALDSLHKAAYANGIRVTTPLYDTTVTTLEKLGIDRGTALHLIERKLEKRLIRAKEKPFRGATP